MIAVGWGSFRAKASGADVQLPLGGLSARIDVTSHGLVNRKIAMAVARKRGRPQEDGELRRAIRGIIIGDACSSANSSFRSMEVLSAEGLELS